MQWQQKAEPRLIKKYDVCTLCTSFFPCKHTTSTYDWQAISAMQVTELAMLVMLPNWVLQWRVVKPMRYMVAGTMLVSRH